MLLTILGLVLVPFVVAATAIIDPAGRAIALTIHVTGLGIAAGFMAIQYPHDRIGCGNSVTLVRLAMTAALGAALAGGGATAWGVTLLTFAALSLDGIDGFLARREGLTSDFGGRFDMEVDVALAAILALALFAAGRAGLELLILGGARYAFVAAAVILPWLRNPLAPSLRRKTVCVIQIGTLAILSAPVLPDAACRPLAILAATLVTWSFARDIRVLAARRSP